ncbi:MAG TPA: hypothetical protein VGQ81_15950, partial [Acidobacteriota bacterium]|nr:hypothetical protein [Acidobacteriota bacterium]
MQSFDQNSSQDSRIEPHLSQIQHSPWYTSAIFALLLDIVAGLVVAGVVLFANTGSRLLVIIGSLGVTALVMSAIIVGVKNRHLTRELVALRNSLQSCQRQYADQLQRIGITEIANSLGSSRWSPDSVMERAQYKVRFVGVFGHKWAMDAQRQDNFRSMLTRIQLNGGKVQFLLLNPNSSAAIQLARYRKQNDDFYKNFPSIEFYKGLSAKFDCFEIRLFEHFPFIRLIFVDGLCAISRFKVHSGAEETLNAPQ